MFEHPAALAGSPVNWPAVRRILVVRPDNLGDVLLAGPALAALRAAAPHTRLDLLASPGGAAAATVLPEVTDAVVARVSWQRTDGPTVADRDPDADLVDRLAAREYDAAVLLTSFSQSPWPAAEVCRRAGIPIRAGLSKEFGGTALTHWVPAPDDGLHQVDRSLHLLGRLGVPAAARTLHAVVPLSGHSRARAALAELGVPAGPYAVVLPGASCPSRRYPQFRPVAAELASCLPVVVCGPAAEEELVRSVADGLPGVHPLAGVLDVPGLAGLLAGAAVAVTNNSGGMHLSDAVGTPVTVLFAGTEDLDQYRPRSVPAAVLGRPVTCSPCRQFRCPFALECLDVPPDEVVAAALDLAGPVPVPVQPRRPATAARCP